MYVHDGVIHYAFHNGNEGYAVLAIMIQDDAKKPHISLPGGMRWIAMHGHGLSQPPPMAQALSAYHYGDDGLSQHHILRTYGTLRTAKQNIGRGSSSYPCFSTTTHMSPKTTWQCTKCSQNTAAARWNNDSGGENCRKRRTEQYRKVGVTLTV